MRLIIQTMILVTSVHALSQSAWGVTLYECRPDQGGAVTYSQMPCRDAEVKRLDVKVQSPLVQAKKSRVHRDDFKAPVTQAQRPALHLIPADRRVSVGPNTDRSNLSQQKSRQKTKPPSNHERVFVARVPQSSRKHPAP